MSLSYHCLPVLPVTFLSTKFLPLRRNTRHGGVADHRGSSGYTGATILTSYRTRGSANVFRSIIYFVKQGKGHLPLHSKLLPSRLQSSG